MFDDDEDAYVDHDALERAGDPTALAPSVYVRGGDDRFGGATAFGYTSGARSSSSERLEKIGGGGFLQTHAPFSKRTPRSAEEVVSSTVGVPTSPGLAPSSAAVTGVAAGLGAAVGVAAVGAFAAASFAAASAAHSSAAAAATTTPR